MNVNITCPEALRQLDDHALAESLAKLSQTERHTGAAIIAHLIVLDERKTYIEMGYASLWKYCTELLGYTAATAQRRKVVVEVARRFPEILARLEDGRLELCAAAMLAPVLTGENVVCLLDRAIRMPLRQVEEMVADLRYASQTNAAKQSPALTFSDESAAPLPQAAEAMAPAALPMPAPKTARVKKRTVTKPLGGDEHRVHVSISKHTVGLHDRVKELMAGEDDDAILAKAFEVLLDKIDPIRRAARRNKRRAKQTAAPSAKKTSRSSAPTPVSRRPSRAVSDQAYVEAGGQCTYVAPDGTRCTSRTFLQDEHHQPFALGGPSTIENIGKLCDAHNALRSREVFGSAYITPSIARRRSSYSASRAPQ